MSYRPAGEPFDPGAHDVAAILAHQGPYRDVDPVTRAWAECDDVAALVRALQLRGPIGDDLLAALVDAGVPVRVFVREVMALHRAVIDAIVSARVRELVAGPMMGELVATTRR